MKFIMLINVKMPIMAGILTFISRINTTSESSETRKIIMFQHFSFYQELQISCSFLTAGPVQSLGI